MKIPEGHIRSIRKEMMVQDKGSGRKSRSKGERARDQAILNKDEGRELTGIFVIQM
jgi:hypothetical protein